MPPGQLKEAEGEGRSLEAHEMARLERGDLRVRLGRIRGFELGEGVGAEPEG